MTNWNVVGGDPAPGSPEVFDAVAGRLASIANAGEIGSARVRTMAATTGTKGWSGDAAVAFGEAALTLPSDLEALKESCQSVIAAAKEYAASLCAYQQQAAEALSRAQSASDDEAAATIRFQQASDCYHAADGQYWFYVGRVGLLEGERLALTTAGDPTAAAQLAPEITFATANRDQAWTSRSAASSDMNAAQQAIDVAQSELREARSSINGIAAAREGAVERLVGLTRDAGEFAVRGRAWMDRIPRDFQPYESSLLRIFHDQQNFGTFLEFVEQMSGHANALV